MKRMVAFAGALGCTVLIGLIAVDSAGGPRVKEAAPGIGLRADISEYPVTADGEHLEGRKVLHVLGDSLFLDTLALVTPETEPHYATKCSDEMSILFDYLMAEEDVRMLVALHRVAQYIQKLPGVEDLPGYDPRKGLGNCLTVKFKDASAPGLILFGSGKRRRWVMELRTSAARERAVEHFYRILEGLKSGSRLRLGEWKQYRLGGGR